MGEAPVIVDPRPCPWYGSEVTSNSSGSSRLAPVPATGNDPFTQEVLESAGRGATIHLFRTMAHHPGLLRKYLPFGYKLLDGGTLTGRQREIIVVRLASSVRCRYELVKHRVIAADEGLTAAEIAALEGGPVVEWSPDEQAIIDATDQLNVDCDLDDATWSALAASLTAKEIVELTMVVGCYRMLAGLLNGARVQLEDEN